MDIALLAGSSALSRHTRCTFDRVPPISWVISSGRQRLRTSKWKHYRHAQRPAPYLHRLYRRKSIWNLDPEALASYLQNAAGPLTMIGNSSRCAPSSCWRSWILKSYSPTAASTLCEGSDVSTGAVGSYGLRSSCPTACSSGVIVKPCATLCPSSEGARRGALSGLPCHMNCTDCQATVCSVRH